MITVIIFEYGNAPPRKKEPISRERSLFFYVCACVRKAVPNKIKLSRNKLFRICFYAGIVDDVITQLILTVFMPHSTVCRCNSSANIQAVFVAVLNQLEVRLEGSFESVFHVRRIYVAMNVFSSDCTDRRRKNSAATEVFSGLIVPRRRSR